MKARFAAILAGALVATSVLSADSVEIGGMKSTTPKEWKTLQTKFDWEVTRLGLPKVEGDKEDAELIISFFKNGSGSEEDNMKRQLGLFEPPEGKEKIESKVGKIKVGKTESTLQDLKGTYLQKAGPFVKDGKVTRKPDYRQLYVIFKNDTGEYYFRFYGPAKTMEKHEKEFEEFLKNFK